MSDWYYAANNEQKGPINESELKAHLASSKIPADTLVWKDGMENWTPANQVPAFTFRAAPAPAAVQPTAAAPAPVAVAAPTSATKASPEVNNPESTKPVDVTDIKGMMGTPQALEVDAEDAEKNKIFGILAYLGILCLIPIIVAKDSPFAKYHANQGLVLFIGEIVIEVVLTLIGIVLAMLPGFLSILSAVFALVWLAPLGLLIYGIINAAAGKCVPLPVIGGIKLLK